MSFTPQFYDDASRLERARYRADQIDKLIGLRGQKILEVGGGHGDLAYVLAQEYGAEVVATEIIAQDSWGELKHPNLHFYEVDISDPDSVSSLFVENSFDRIVSFVVWEHMLHPFSALSACQKLLKPEGKKYLHAYLMGAPRLSHLHYAIPDPWLHLLSSEKEIKERLQLAELPYYYYCNRLTHSHYMTYFRKLGFYITYENLIREPFNEPYFLANKTILDLFPIYDLKTHGLQVVLEFDKAAPKAEIADPLYKFCNYRSG